MSKRFLSMSLATIIFIGMFATVIATPAFALSGEESQFVSSHNRIRGSYGRSTLPVYDDLVAIARSHSRDMAARGDIYHNPNLGSEVRGWTVVGENVGEGGSVPDLMDAFMNSPAHRSNILDSDYNQFGIGVVNKEGTIYVTVVFAHRSGGRRSPSRRAHVSHRRGRSTPRHGNSRRRSAPASAQSAPVSPAPMPASSSAQPSPAPPFDSSTRTVDMLVQIQRL
ncbi:MAG: hypothetical protein NVSMB57_08280 [Actinomycetota bacterium]